MRIPHRRAQAVLPASVPLLLNIQPFMVTVADVTRRPRIVYIDHTAKRSGGEIALVRTVQALGDAIEAHVILGESGDLQGELERAGATVHVLPMADVLRNRRKESVTAYSLLTGGLRQFTSGLDYVRKLRATIGHLDADIVHTNSLKADLLGGLAGRLARRKVVWHVRDMISSPYLTPLGVFILRVGANVIPHRILVNSQATRSTLPAWSRPRVVYNSVLYDAVPADWHSVPSTEKRNHVRIGIIGRIAPWKGQDVFLKAFAIACRDAACEAVIVGGVQFGEDGYLEQLRSLVQALGIADRVTFTGHQESVAEELASLDVFVHASTSPEPFGQVLVEAMRARVPVIAAAAGGPLEIVTDGVDGLLAPPGDVSAYAAAIRRLIDDPDLRSRLASAGYASSKRFSPEALRANLLDVYRGLLTAS